MIGRVNRCALLMLLITGCAAPAATNKPHLATVSSFAQPALVTLPTGSIAIVNYVPLAWTNNDPSTVSYNLYWSDTGPHVYEHMQSSADTICVVSNMPVGATWYFAATSVDANGGESDFSDQYAYTLPPMLDIGLQFPQQVTNTSVESSTDLISWQPLAARLRDNGLWRISIYPNFPIEFYRGIGQSVTVP
jgi:hypothetical protein